MSAASPNHTTTDEVVTGEVFDISYGCVDDGPGLRTTVFLKRCNLGCPWCHNPEGRQKGPQIGYDIDRCIRCGRCADVCPRSWSIEQPNSWREGCLICGRCVEACPSGARRIVGRPMSVDELMTQVLRDRDFFAGTGGGVTFSGGEPMLQPAFLFECAQRLADEGIHVAVETAGLWSAKLVPKLAESVDLVLFDLKHVDRDKLRTVMGKDCTLILENLASLLESDAEIELRLTLVPGFNDGDDDLTAFAEWLNGQTRIPPIVLQAFHRMASAKEHLYDLSYAYADVEPLGVAQLQAARAFFAERGLDAVA